MQINQEVLTAEQVSTLDEIVQELPLLVQFVDISKKNLEEQQLREIYEDFFNLLSRLFTQVKLAILNNKIKNLPDEIRSQIRNFHIGSIANQKFGILPENVQRIIRDYNLADFSELPNAYNQLFKNYVLYQDRKNTSTSTIFDAEAPEVLSQNFTSRDFFLSISTYLEEVYERQKNTAIESLLQQINIETEFVSEARHTLLDSIEFNKRELFEPFNLLPETLLPKKTEEEVVDTHLMENIAQKAIFAGSQNNLSFVKMYSAFLTNSKLEDNETNLISQWQLVMDAYNAMKENESETVLGFFITYMDFYKKFTSVPQINELESPQTMVVAFSQLILNKGLKLEQTPEKNKILKDWLRQINIINAVIDEREVIYDQLAVELMEHDQLPEFMTPQQTTASDTLRTTIIARNIQHLQAFNSFNTIAFSNNEDQDKLSADHVGETDQNYRYLTDYLLATTKDERASLKPIIIAQTEASITFKKVKADLHHRPKKSEMALGELQRLKLASQQTRTKGAIENIGLEHQAAFKHQISLSKYRISDEETALLKKMTGLPVTKLVFIKKKDHIYGDDTLTHGEFLQKISEEKLKRVSENQKGFRKYLPFLRLPVDILDQATVYVQYHHIKMKSTKNPEKTRLNPIRDGVPQEGFHRDKNQSGKAIRKVFSKNTKKLSSLFSRNKALQELDTILQSKTKLADELKKKATLLSISSDPKYKEGQIATRAQKTHERLLNAQHLFVPSNLSATTLFKTYPVSEEVRLLAENYYDVINFINAMYNKIKTAQQNAEQANHGKILPRFPKGYNDKDKSQQAMDPLKLDSEIKSILSSLIEPSNDSTKEEYQDYINSVNLALRLAIDVRSILKEQINFLGLNEYKQVLKLRIKTKHCEILDSCKTPDGFNPEDSFALNRVGEMLTRSKEACASLKEISISYLSMLEMQISTKQQVLGFLRSLLHPNEEITNEQIILKLRAFQQQLTSDPTLAFHIIADEAALPHADAHIPGAKINEMFSDITKISTQLATYSVEEVVSDYEKSITVLTATQKHEQATVRKLISDAKQTVDSFTYLADHTTNSLQGARRPG